MRASGIGFREAARSAILHTALRESAQSWEPAERPLSLGRWAAAAFFLVLVATRAFYLGDTMKYVAEIVPSYGLSPTAPGNRLWEFGHLLWRPLGWLLLKVLAPVLVPITGWEPSLVCAFGLMAVSIVCGLLTVLLWYSLANEIAGSNAVAFLVALAFGCANAFLTYTHSGSSYVPGLLCVTLGVWVLRKRRVVRTAAALAALATLLWVPYVFSVPGMLFIGLWPLAGPAAVKDVVAAENLRFLAHFVLVFLLCLVLGFGLGAWGAHIDSAAQAKAWVSDASHGWQQNSRLLRMGTGLPRTFLFMGRDGVLYRRFLRRDPYAPVSVLDLVQASLWKVVLFNIFVLALLYELWRSRRWGVLLALAMGAAPVLLFAVLVFEPGSPERYLPAYPFVVMAVASALRGFPGSRRPAQLAVAVFLCAMIAANLYYMNRISIGREDSAALSRIEGLKRRLPANSLVAIVTNLDTIEEIVGRVPFHAINRPIPFRLYDVVEPSTARLPQWREDFARYALAAWSQGAEVWVSKRFTRAGPLPQWNWVEGDDKRISWKEIPTFFAPLETDAETGGTDGFSRVKYSDRNVSLLTAAVRPVL